MSNESGVYVGAVAVVKTHFVKLKSNYRDYCPQCNERRHGRYCKVCGTQLVFSQKTMPAFYYAPLGEDDESFNWLRNEDLYDQAIFILSDNYGSDCEIDATSEITPEVITTCIENFKAFRVKELQLMRDHGFEVEVKFMYVEWAEF